VKTQREIKIETPYITLGQFLKLADIIASGGQAKSFLENHAVIINGGADNRRGRKIYPGDEVKFEDGTYVIVAS